MAVRVSEDIVSISDFKARAPELLRRIAKSKQPVVLTQNGKTAGVVISAEEYDRLTESERVRAVVKRGLADIKAGRVYTQEEVEARLAKAAMNGGRGIMAGYLSDLLPELRKRSDGDKGARAAGQPVRRPRRGKAARRLRS